MNTSMLHELLFAAERNGRKCGNQIHRYGVGLLKYRRLINALILLQIVLVALTSIAARTLVAPVKGAPYVMQVSGRGTQSLLSSALASLKESIVVRAPPTL